MSSTIDKSIGVLDFRPLQQKVGGFPIDVLKKEIKKQVEKDHMPTAGVAHLLKAIVELQFVIDWSLRTLWFQSPTICSVWSDSNHGPLLWDKEYTEFRGKYDDYVANFNYRRCAAPTEQGRAVLDAEKAELEAKKEALEAKLTAKRDKDVKDKRRADVFYCSKKKADLDKLHAAKCDRAYAKRQAKAKEQAQDVEAVESEDDQPIVGAAGKKMARVPHQAPKKATASILDDSDRDVRRSATLLEGVVVMYFMPVPAAKGTTYLALPDDSDLQGQADDVGFIPYSKFERKNKDASTEYDTEYFFSDIATVGMYKAINKGRSVLSFVPHDIPGGLRKYQVYPEHVYNRFQAAAVFFEANGRDLSMYEINQAKSRLNQPSLLYHDYVAEQRLEKVRESKRTDFMQKMKECSDTNEMLEVTKTGKQLVSDGVFATTEIQTIIQDSLAEYLLSGGCDGEVLLGADQIQELMQAAYDSGFVSADFQEAHDIDEYLAQRDEFTKIGDAILNDQIEQMNEICRTHGDLAALFTTKVGIHHMPGLWKMYQGKYKTYLAMQKQLSAMDAQSQQVASQAAVIAAGSATERARINELETELRAAKERLAQAAVVPPPPADPVDPMPVDPAPPPPAAPVDPPHPAPPPINFPVYTIGELAEDVIRVLTQVDNKNNVYLTVKGVVDYHLYNELPPEYEGAVKVSEKRVAESVRDILGTASARLDASIKDVTARLPAGNAVAVLVKAVSQAASIPIPSGGLRDLGLTLISQTPQDTYLVAGGLPTDTGKLAQKLAYGVSQYAYLLYGVPGDVMPEIELYDKVSEIAGDALHATWPNIRRDDIDDMLRSAIVVGVVCSGYFNVSGLRGKTVHTMEEYFEHLGWDEGCNLFTVAPRVKAKRMAGEIVVDLTVDEVVPAVVPAGGAGGGPAPKRARTHKKK
jgi:hypothetical protein